MNGFSSIVANTYRVYDEKLLSDPNFMAGWRVWSFYKTLKAESSTMDVTAKDKDLIVQMTQKGREVNSIAYTEWNRFRSNVLSIFPSIDKRMHYHDQYRHIFKRVAFVVVVVDCCFAIKLKMNSEALRELLTDKFKATDSHEQPTYFIILDNHITDSEFDHKLNQFARGEYRGTQDKILDYRSYNPKLNRDRIAIMRVPFGVTHKAMSISEGKVRKKMSDSRYGGTKVYSRAGINDFSLIFMIDKIRRSFGLCARVALLSDDFGMLHYASTFYAGSAASEMTGIYPNLPRAYEKDYIVTPFLLDPFKWNAWRHGHVHPYFANHIADV